MDEHNGIAGMTTEVVEDKTCGATNIQKVFDGYYHDEDAMFGDYGSDNFSMYKFIDIGAQRPIERDGSYDSDNWGVHVDPNVAVENGAMPCRAAKAQVITGWDAVADPGVTFNDCTTIY